MKMGKKFDVLVVGGGHAGVEAAAAAARIGARTGLLSLNPSAVGRMSCNPAIGGIGKGQLAREVDALGGLMGLAADRAGIQFRTLNTSKGRAVQSPRAQCDREGYEKVVQELLEEQGGVEVIAGEATELLFRGESTQAGLRGVRMADGETILAPAVILTTGTFLEGILHTGGEQQAGGRVGEDGAAALGAALRAAGLKTNRLKTGTPPRIALDSVDFSKMEEQPGDANPCRFSFLSEAIERDQISCWITRTSERTHEIVRANLHLAPMYAGRIEGRGPRYCPSIEDKIVRFADRSEHQVFLEPEGFTSDVLYANGISTSLPVEVQEQFVRTIVGMEKARIVQPGYAVEYTFISPSCLRRTMEVRSVPGLYLAGQICGTSGYEEAAAQGIMAGFNAALKLAGQAEFVLGRHQAYIGVLIDDLVVCDPNEPYRMFTSRAEHRLLLRHDTADRRLTPLAASIGGVSTLRAECNLEKQDRIQKVKQRLERERPDLLKILRRHDGGLESMLQQEPAAREWLPEFDHWQTLEADIQYAGYEARQWRWVERSSERENTRIPEGFDYTQLSGLRNEAREWLIQKRPSSLGVAGRLAGVSPADLALLEVALVRESAANRS